MTLPNGHDLADELAEIRRRLGDLERAAPLRSASLSGGGLTIRGGGALRVVGGDVEVLEGGDVRIAGGGVIRVEDGGALHSDDFDGEDLDEPGTDGWWLGPEGIVVNRAVIRTGQLPQLGSLRLAKVHTDLGYEEFLSITVPRPDWARSAQVLAFATGGTQLFTSSTRNADVEARIWIEGDTDPGCTVVDSALGQVNMVKLRSGGDNQVLAPSHGRNLPCLLSDIDVTLETSFWQSGGTPWDENNTYLQLTVFTIFSDVLGD